MTAIAPGDRVATADGYAGTAEHAADPTHVSVLLDTGARLREPADSLTVLPTDDRSAVGAAVATSAPRAWTMGGRVD